MTSKQRADAVKFAMGVIVCPNPRTLDWQEVTDALANHAVFGDLLQGDDGMAMAQSIVSEAEEKLGNEIPDYYSN